MRQRISRRDRARFRVGRVSVYLHRSAWWLYFRENDRPVRRRVAETREAAERIAAEVNAQLSAATATMFAFEPMTIGALREEFLRYHEQVRRSSVATIRRYRTATQHLVDYQQACRVHEAAVAQQKTNSGADVSPETRKELAKKTAEADKNKRTIEDVAMADHTEAKEFAKQIKEATAELAAASKRKTDAIESDPKLSSAKTAFLRTRDELKTAKTALDQADGEANRIRSAMQSLVNQRASIQNQLQNHSQQQQSGKVSRAKGKAGSDLHCSASPLSRSFQS